MPQKIPSYNFFPKLYFPGGNHRYKKSFVFLGYSQRTGGNHAKFAFPRVHYHDDDDSGRGARFDFGMLCGVADVLFTLPPLPTIPFPPPPRSTRLGRSFEITLCSFPPRPPSPKLRTWHFLCCTWLFWVFSSVQTTCFLCVIVFFCVAPGHFFRLFSFLLPAPLPSFFAFGSAFRPPTKGGVELYTR